MMYEYTYPKPPVRMNAGQLSEEIEAEMGYGTRISINSKEVKVRFRDELTPEEIITLDTLVADHIYVPVHVNPYQESIDLLSEPSWGSGLPEKTELLRQVLLRLLNA